MFDLVTSQMATAVQCILMAVGLISLWLVWLGPKARANPMPAALPVWILRTSEFFLFICCLCAGAFVTSVLITVLAQIFIKDKELFTIVAGTAFHPGLILGVIVFVKFFEKKPKIKPTPPRPVNSVKAGFVTFTIILLFVFATTLVTNALFHFLNIPLVKQPFVEILLASQNPYLLPVFFFTAVIVAPIAEELIFRYGLFRFARFRLPSWVAYLLPSLAFGAVHMNLASFVALTVFGIIQSIAYERTGSIKVPIIAHMLFNLNSALTIYLAGNP